MPWLRALVCGGLLLQVLLAQAQQRAFKYLRHEHGLGNLAVTALAQDPAGELWIGTENGLYRFDGGRMRRYGPTQGLVDVRVTALHVDASGRLWVAGEAMLFHREGERFVQIRQRDDAITLKPGQSLASTGDRLVANTRAGLYWVSRTASGWQASEVFSAAERQRRPELADVYSVLGEHGGAIWFGCARMLCRLGASGLRQYRPAGPAPAERWTTLLRMADGRLWLRSPTQLWRLDAGSDAPVRVPMPPGVGLSASWNPALGADSQGRILTQHGTGIVRWDGQRMAFIGTPQGLQAGGGVSTLLQTRDGSLWLGTAGVGLARWLGYRHAQSWGQAEGLPADDAWSFLRARNGQMYVGTTVGLGTDRSAQSFKTAAPTQAPEVASSLAEDGEGQVWVGSFNGLLSRFDPASGRLRPVARLPRITQLLVDRQGQLWIITHHGIYLLRDPTRDTRPQRIDEVLFAPKTLPPEANDACLMRSGEIWISTAQGLLRNDAHGLARVHVLAADGQKTTPGDLTTIACRDQRLWVGGNSGLWQARTEPGATALRFERVQTPLLQDRAIVALRFDRRGWLWAGTDYGVAVTDLHRWRAIRQNAGLPWDDCNQGALYADADGSIWVGTPRGTAHLRDLDALFDKPDLNVNVQVAGTSIAIHEGHARLTLPWHKRSVVLNLGSVAFEQRDALRFEYRLDGQDDGWRSGASTEVVYPSLQPGRYRFEVRARNLDQQAESPLQTLAIEVLPPWWRTAWFYGLITTLGALSMWAGHRWRLRRLLANQARLERLIAERTREIEASHAQMRELALKDGLTGVLNRRALDEALATEVARAGRGHIPLALVIVDADRFKLINDQHGHPAGDAVLVTIAQRLKAPTRPYDAVGRYGGEEFVLVLPDLDVASEAGHARIASFHQAICDKPVTLPSGQVLPVTCSFGVASMAAGQADTPAALIDRADAALYRAKENGRNRIEYG
ncbi:diguanylate cyclase [Roseateles sp. LYH14W]|uniref:diguanylate cyclase n=1 Tax=Pelomonas parva TaxID=3299032 RepID=A0ABW7FA32_9BURK